MKLRSWPTQARWLLEIVVLAVVYFAAAKLGLSLSFAGTNVSPVWPPTGVALAAVLLLGYRVWPGIWLGAFLANVTTFTANDISFSTAILTSSMISVGSTLEAVAAVLLIRHFVSEQYPFDEIQDIFKFILFGVLLAPMVSATIGVVSLMVSGIAATPTFGYLWWTWWLGDAMGTLLVAPVILVLSGERWPHWPWQRWGEALFLFGMLAVGTWLIFGENSDFDLPHYHSEYLLFPLAVVITFRFGQLGATLSTLLVAAITMSCTALGYGPFALDSVNDSLLLLQTYLAVFAGLSLVLASTITERDYKEAELRLHQTYLEDIVNERTAESTKTNTRLAQEIKVRQQAEKTLQESKQMLQLIMNNIPLAIFWKDSNSTYLGCNREFAADAGLDSPDEIIGKNDFDFPWVEQAESYRLDDREVMETGTSKLYYEEPQTTPTGEKLWLRTSKIPLLDPEKNVIGVLGMYEDISERRQAAEALRQRNRELAMLNEASRALSSTLDLDEVLKSVVAEVHRLPDVLACSVWLVDPESGEVVCREATEPRRELVFGWRLAPGEGLVGWVVEHKQSLNVPDVLADERHFKGVDRETGLELRSILTVPLQVKQKVIGVMQVVDEAVGRFGETHQTLLESLAATAAIAIQNAQWYEQARQDAETKLALFHEVNHRVKNNLTAIIGLLYAERRHAAAEGRTYRDIINTLINRVQGLATVHELLSAAEWRPLPLSDLAQQVMHAALQVMPAQQVCVDITPSPVEVSPAQANQLALIINELTTNAMKYAFAEREKGKIIVQIVADDGTVHFEFHDDGPGYPDDVLQLERHNVGLYLIQTLVQSGLQGELKLYNDNGAVTAIDFNLTQ